MTTTAVLATRPSSDFDVPHLPARLDTPAVVVDVDRMQANIDRMAQHLAARGVALRPHVKTHKSVQIARRQLAAGAAGVTCATLGEAEVMAAGGITDVFIAYPLWAGGEKGSRVATLHEHVSLTVGVDSVEGCAALGAATAGARSRLPVLVEVDSGELRTGAVTLEQALVVARAARQAGLEVRGAFTHGGHSYAPGAAQPAADDEVRVLEAAGRALTAEGFEVRTLSAGSTPTALLSSRGAVTEERPGTYVFGDRQQAHYGSDPREVAMVVAATVVSTAAPDQFVIDAGAKALGKDRPPWMQGHGAVPACPDAVITRLYDHHGVCEVPEGAARPRVGEVVAVVPNHACPVLNLATSFTVVSGGQSIGQWAVDARARNA